MLGLATTQFAQYFRRERTTFDLPLRTQGDPLSEQVWDLRMAIPYGATTTYGAIARELGLAEEQQRACTGQELQRWNDDGSAEVLIATKVTSKTPDGKSTMESGSRWVATTIKEGQQWKISNLVQVI